MPGRAILRLNENEWTVSLATTYAELVWGLSGVTSIPSRTGVLFVLPTDQPVSVTTEALLFNIDIIFVSSGLEVVDVARNVAPGNIVTEDTPVRYFLEVNAGEADDIESGDIAGITIYQMAATTMTNWIAPLVSFVCLMAIAAFMVSTTRSITKAMLGEPTEKLKLLPQTETREKKTMAAFLEIAEWYCKYQRPMTVKELRPIATKYFGTAEELTEFYEYLASPQGQKEFRRELRDAMRRHNIPIPPEEEWLTMTQEFLPQTELSLSLIEGGEPMPIQYRYLAGWISEPLPEYSLAVELLPAVEVGERKIDAVLKQLKDGVESIQESEKFRLFLVTMSKFHDYSIGNQILIMIQKPEATRVAGFNTWKDMGRWVKKGEKGIAILAPVMPPRPTCPKCGTKLPKGVRFCPQCGEGVEVEEEIGVTPRYFKVVYVFDISQTEGKPLPEFEVPVLTGEANEELFAKVMVLAKSQGLEISFESRPYQDPSIKGQLFDKSIWVRPEETRAQQLKTLLHEVAHYYTEGVFRIPRRDAETIAESAAFSIGAHFGFDSGVRSFPYVALWAKDKKVLEQNLSAIRRVATQIIDSIEKSVHAEKYEPDTEELLKEANIVVITKESHPKYYKELLRLSGKQGGVYEPETGRIILLDRVTGVALHEIGHELFYSGKVPPDVLETFKEEMKSLKLTDKFKQLYGEQDYAEVWADVFAKVAKGKDVPSFPQTTIGIKKMLKPKGQPAVIPTKPRPRHEGDLEYLADSPEFLAQTIADIGFRDKLDTAFQEAIERVKGLK